MIPGLFRGFPQNGLVNTVVPNKAEAKAPVYAISQMVKKALTNVLKTVGAAFAEKNSSAQYAASEDISPDLDGKLIKGILVSHIVPHRFNEEQFLDRSN